jgi:GH35 family endo-1,4-beta-xylanase
MKTLYPALILILCLMPSLLLSGEPPPGGEVLIAPDDIDRFVLEPGDGGTCELVAVEGPGFDRAIRVTSRGRGMPWDVEPWIALERPFKEGEVLLLRVWVRKIESGDESTQVLVSPNLGMRRAPWITPLSRDIMISGDWEAFWVPGVVPGDLGPDDLFLRFFGGEIPQVVEIGGISLWSYGTSARMEDMPATLPQYEGMEPGAAWRTEAKERIEALRTALIRIRVIDTHGRPLPGVGVELELIRHAFPFGSAVSAHELAGPDREANAANRAQFLSLFNAGTFYNDLKWPAWVGEWEETFSRDQTLEALDWFRAHHLSFRGHVLVWPGWENLPEFIVDRKDDLSGEDLDQLMMAHIDEITLATRGLVSEWDVINEPRSNDDVEDAFGRDFLVDCFKRARHRLPDAGLALNEFGLLTSRNDIHTVNPHLETVRYLMDAGAPLSVLGVQGHMGGSFNPPVRLLEVLDRLSSTGLPIRITEFTLRTEFPEIVERYSRDFLTVMFSHPSVIGVQTWGTRVMFEEDGSLTPAGQAWRDLIHGEWKTVASGATDEAGLFSARGYLGRYTVTLTKGDLRLQTEIDLNRDKGDLILTLSGRPD